MPKLRSNRSLMPATLLAIALIAVVGCRPAGSDRGGVSGCITYESQPVSEGTVVFENAAQGWIRVSPLDAEGRYFLQNVREGEYVVSIQPPEPELPSEATHSPAELRAALAATAIPDPKNIPRRVRASQTTPLTATVGQGRHEFDFELAELNR